MEKSVRRSNASKEKEKQRIYWLCVCVCVEAMGFFFFEGVGLWGAYVVLIDDARHSPSLARTYYCSSGPSSACIGSPSATCWFTSYAVTFADTVGRSYQ
jgi:hypothetical protein